MRTRRLSRPGRIAVYFLSFLMAFSSASTFTIQAVEAAVATAVVRGEADLQCMLSVGTIVDEDWMYDEPLQKLLTQRDIEASEYARENCMPGVYNTSGELEGTADSTWLSNVMYEGDVLRYSDFPGFIVSYDDADAAIIAEGINEIGVTIVPIADVTISGNGIETDINSWETKTGYVSRFMLPHWIGMEQMTLKRGWVYKTKMFIVGLSNIGTARNSIFSEDMMSYVEYLDYIHADPTASNMESYMNYVNIYDSINTKNKERQDRLNEEWLEWQRLSNRESYGTKDRISEPRIEDRKYIRPNNQVTRYPLDPEINDASYPPIEGSLRTIMVYMDGTGLNDYAVSDLKTMIDKSGITEGTLGINGLGEEGVMEKAGMNRLLVLTGGSTEWDTDTLNLYDSDGITRIYDIATDRNQLWEIKGGKMILVNDDFATGYYMTDTDTLRKFLEVGTLHYPTVDTDGNPTNMYDLFMWGHGGGPDSGFGADEGKMSTIDIVEALEDSGVVLDIIAFDACKMGNAEIALAISPYATYLLAPETDLPYEGIGYEWLERLIERPELATFDGTRGYNINTGLNASYTLAPLIVRSVYEKYVNANENDRLSDQIISFSFIDLEYVDNIADALVAFSENLYEEVTNPDDDRDVLYALLKVRKKLENNANKNNYLYTNLIDMSALFTELSYAEDKIDAPKVFTGEYENIPHADRVVMSRFSTMNEYWYSSSTSFGDSNGIRTKDWLSGLSIYFPSTNEASYISRNTEESQLETILSLYERYYDSDYTDNRVKKALSAYALWVSTGRLLSDYWRTDITEREIREIEADVISAANNAGIPSETVTNIITAQINERIKEENLTVIIPTDMTKRDVTLEKVDDNGNKTAINKNVIDRIEVKVSVSDDIGGDGETDKISLGSTDKFYKKGSNDGEYTLFQFDNKWLTLDGLNGQVVSYYDTSEVSVDINETRRSGVIPVAYWVTQNTGENKVNTIQEAIRRGMVILGVFEVVFNADDTTGTIVAFRGITDNSMSTTDWEIKNKEVYELLANYDIPGDDYENLVSLGNYQIDTSKADYLGVTFQNVKDLDVEYHILDVYESQYDLSDKIDGETFREEIGSSAIYKNKPTSITNEVDDHDNFTGFYSDADRGQIKSQTEDVLGDAYDDGSTTPSVDINEDKFSEYNNELKKEDNSSIPPISTVILTPDQQVFLANISLGIQSGALTLEQASTLMVTADITPEMVDTYLTQVQAAASAGVSTDPDPVMTDPSTDVTAVTNPMAMYADPTTDLTVVLTGTSPDASAEQTGLTAAPGTGAANTDPISGSPTEHVDEALPEDRSVSISEGSDDNGSCGDGGDGGSPSDGGSDDSGSSSGSDSSSDSSEEGGSDGR